MKMLTAAAAVALALGLAPVTASAQDAGNTATTGTSAGGTFGTYDANRDAMLSEDEYGTIGTDFDRFDADRSGSIDREEYTAWGQETWGEDWNEEENAGLFDTWDEDRDDQLAETEFGNEDAFGEWDENESGVLEEDEGWF